MEPVGIAHLLCGRETETEMNFRIAEIALFSLGFDSEWIPQRYSEYTLDYASIYAYKLRFQKLSFCYGRPKGDKKNVFYHWVCISIQIKCIFSQKKCILWRQHFLDFVFLLLAVSVTKKMYFVQKKCVLYKKNVKYIKKMWNIAFWNQKKKKKHTRLTPWS